MAYMIDQANRVAEQLERFTTGYAHHVVGQHANLDFWLDEATHAIEAIEGYSDRFSRMADAQRSWVEAHGTLVGSYCPQCGGACELEEKMKRPSPPRRYSSGEGANATRRLRDAAYYFLRRCFRLSLVDEPAFRAACEHLKTSVDPSDLERS